MNNPIMTALAEPALLDLVCGEIAAALKSGFPWLGNAYGKAEKQAEIREKRKYVFPSVFVNAKEYLRVFPDEHLQNHSFFHIEDGETLTTEGGVITVGFRLVFWYDLRTVYPGDWQSRTNENVKSEVLQFLRTAYFKRGKIELSGVRNEARNIYAGYSDNQIKTQFLMRPYGGFALTGILKYKESNCYG